MKKFIFIATLISVCLSCIACNNKQNKDSISTIVEDDSYIILFDFDNIDDVMHIECDDEFYIHYCDYDVFDYDNLAYRTGNEHWYGEYVAIKIDYEILHQFLNDYFKYKSSTNNCYKQELNDKYTIVEHDITYQDSTKDITFYLEVDDIEDN